MSRLSNCFIIQARFAFALIFLCLGSQVFAQNTPDIIWRANFYSWGKPIYSVAFSPDGALVAGCLDRTTSVWRVSDKSLLYTFARPAEPYSVAFSRNGELLGVGDISGGREVWRPPNGESVWATAAGDRHPAYSVAFSPDSTLFAMGMSDLIMVSEAQRNSGIPFENPLGQDGDERGVLDIRFSPDGKLLASANVDHTASLFNMPEGKLVRDLMGHPGTVCSIDFSPDGTMLATGANDGTARLWRTTNGAQIRMIEGGGGSGLPLSAGCGRARFTADGKALLTSSNGTMRFWRVSDGKLLLTYTNAGNGSGVFAVSPNGKHFAYATGSVDDTNASVVLARMPLVVTSASVRTNALELEWQGGTGLYQVEQRTNAASGEWKTVGGPTTNTNLSVPATNRAEFFRVGSLPNETK